MLDIVLGMGMGYICEEIHQNPFLHKFISSKRETVNFILVDFGSAVEKIRAG